MQINQDITLYLGGTRSGKSQHAENHALSFAKGNVYYLATAQKRDDISMKERIRKHQERRPSHWINIESPLDIVPSIQKYLAKHENPFSNGTQNFLPEKDFISDTQEILAEKNSHKPTILIDCITLWVSNLLFSLENPEDSLTLEELLHKELALLISFMQSTNARFILVSGETGLGGVSANILQRNFDDALGLANQNLATVAHQSFFCIAGKCLKL